MWVNAIILSYSLAVRIGPRLLSQRLIRPVNQTALIGICVSLDDCCYAVLPWLTFATITMLWHCALQPGWRDGVPSVDKYGRGLWPNPDPYKNTTSQSILVLCASLAGNQDNLLSKSVLLSSSVKLALGSLKILSFLWWKASPISWAPLLKITSSNGLPITALFTNYIHSGP